MSLAMFDFAPTPDASKAEAYDELARSAAGLIMGESDPVANMANLAALLWLSIPRLNWAGFYRAIDGELVLGPFIGKPACIRIPFGQGVCGTAATLRATQLVRDVHEFPGHIACDAASRSELVVPILVNGSVRAVIDLDSPECGRFDAEDARGLELFAQVAAELRW